MKELNVFKNAKYGDFGPYRAQRTGQVDLLFTGKFLGRKSTYRAGDVRSYSYQIFILKEGGYVATKEGKSLRPGERVRTSASVCKNEEEVIEFLGYGDAQRVLYALCDFFYEENC